MPSHNALHIANVENLNLFMPLILAHDFTLLTFLNFSPNKASFLREKGNKGFLTFHRKFTVVLLHKSEHLKCCFR